MSYAYKSLKTRPVGKNGTLEYVEINNDIYAILTATLTDGDEQEVSRIVPRKMYLEGRTADIELELYRAMLSIALSPKVEELTSLADEWVDLPRF